MAKILHVIGALVISITLIEFSRWLGWDWAWWVIAILFWIYVLAIIFSPRTSPVPLSRASLDRYDAYMVYCSAMGKKPSITEDDNEWIPKAPYPIEVMAGFKRLIDAFLGWSRPRGCLAALTPSLRRYVKLEKQRDFFVAACQAKGIDAAAALDGLIRLAYPNMPQNDHQALGRMVAEVRKSG